jgi:hypothetical protein
MRAFLFAFFFFSSSLQAQDFSAQPRAMCDFMSKAGMTAQFQWAQPRPDAPYLCQHAEQMSGTSKSVRSGRASVDVATKEVDLALSVQGLGGNIVRLEARDLLKPLVVDFFKAQGKNTPARVIEMLDKEITAPETVDGLRVAYSKEMWEKHSVVGISFSTQIQSQLDARCVKAIEQSGQTNSSAQWQRKVMPFSQSHFQFDYAQADGTFSCNACDDLNPTGGCSALGVLLSFKPSTGDSKKMPAEFDQKCVHALQRKLKDPSDKKFIDYGLVKRIQVSAQHTDTRWAYMMKIDTDEYRCVIRRSDWAYTVEERAGANWTGIAAGRIY